MAAAVASFALASKRMPSSSEDVVGVGEHVDQVRDRRALIARDVRHAGLQQRLGDGENALAAELLARAEPKLRDLALERAFRHASVRLCVLLVADPRLT